MRYYVEINGNSSLDIEGLAIKELPPITKPLIRSQIEEIDGRDGDIITELGYSAYDKSIEIGLYGSFDIDAIIKYFTGEGTITFSNEPDKFYYFKLLNQIDYEKLLKFKTAVVTFHCQPFKYPVEETPIEGESVEVSGSGSNISLSNTIVAPMEMKVKGNTIQNGTPTPSSPIEIQNVNGNNTLNVCGKNLFNDIRTDSTTLRGVSCTPVEQGIKLNGTFDKQYNLDLWLTDSNPSSYSNNMVLLKANTKYSFSIFVESGSMTNTSITAWASSRTASDKVFNWNYKIFGGYSNGKWTTTYTTGNEDIYLGGIRFAINRNDTITFNDAIIKVQVEEGEATTYTPYTSNSYDIDLGVENLFDIDHASWTLFSSANPARYSTLQNGWYNQSYMEITFTPTETQTISFYVKKRELESGEYNYSGKWLIRKDSTTVAYDTGGDSTTYVRNTYTMEANHTYLLRVYNHIFINDIQLEKGSVAHTFTPYGKAIELCKIGTYQDKIDKSSGKNLFDKDTVSNGYIEANGTITSNNDYRTSDFIPIKPNTAYYKTLTFSPRTKFFDSNKQPLNTTTYQDISIGGDAGTFTTPNNAYYLRLTINITSTVSLDMVMINEGSTALPYEPYGTGWYLKKEIGKVVLNGTQSGLRTPTNVSGDYRMCIDIGTNIYSGAADITAPFYCDKFKTTNRNNSYAEVEGIAPTDTGFNYKSFIIYYSATKNMTYAEFQTWLASNNVVVYYPYATPTYETITDTTLLSQLEALKPYSYNPVTNITQTNDDAPFELDVSLSYTNTMNVNNVGNIYAKPILTIEGSGNIGIILNDIEVLSVDLGTDEKITIDVPNLQAYNPDNDVLLNRNVTGDYMKLLINDGDNTIAFSGSVTSATLTNYIRWI